MQNSIKAAARSGIIVVVLLGLGVGCYFLSAPQKVTAQATTPSLGVAQNIPTVSVKDLSMAGFTNPTVQPPTGSRFQPPLAYFRVKESAADPNWQKDGVANLVAVNIFPTPYSAIAVTNSPVINNFSGRVSVCDSRVGVYFCVIGPDQQKGEALVNLLKTK